MFALHKFRSYTQKCLTIRAIDAQGGIERGIARPGDSADKILIKQRIGGRGRRARRSLRIPIPVPSSSQYMLPNVTIPDEQASFPSRFGLRSFVKNWPSDCGFALRRRAVAALPPTEARSAAAARRSDRRPVEALPYPESRSSRVFDGASQKIVKSRLHRKHARGACSGERTALGAAKINFRKTLNE
jgi:hypothetical protein